MLIKKHVPSVISGKALQFFLLLSFPLIFISQRLYFYSLIAAIVAFIISKPWTYKPDKEQIKLIVYYLVFILLHAISLLWTEDVKHGLRAIETYSGFLALPFLFLWQKDYHNAAYLKLVCIVIVGTALLVCFFAQSQALYLIIKQGGNFSDLFFSSRFLYTELSELVNLHPTYFGILINTAIIILGLALLRINRTSAQFWIFLLLILYLLLFLFLLLSRGPILSLFGVVAYLFISNFSKFKLIIRLSLIVIFLGGLSSIVIFKPLHERFVEPVLKVVTDKSYEDKNDSFSLHIKSWVCSLQSNRNILEVLAGHGTGDELVALQVCYDAKNYDLMITRRLNAHCEYLTQYVKLGLVGVGFILFFLYQHFHTSNNNQSHIKLMVIVISIVILFESSFNMSKGVFFVSYLFPFFYLLDKEKNKE